VFAMQTLCAQAAPLLPTTGRRLRMQPTTFQRNFGPSTVSAHDVQRMRLKDVHRTSS